MTRKLTIDGRSAALIFDSQDGECAFEFTLEDETRKGSASVIEVAPGVFSVLIEGRSFEVRVAQDSYEVDGVRIDITVEDPRAPRSADAPAGREGRAMLLAPMPGKVVRVLVEEGQQVEAGQGIVVIEAMKMQNEMKSPKAGTVVSLKAQTGAAVTAGDLLAVVE